MMLIPTILHIVYFLFFMNCFYKIKHKITCFTIFFAVSCFAIYLVNMNGIQLLGKILFLFTCILFATVFFRGQLKEKIITTLIAFFVLGSAEFLAMMIYDIFHMDLDINNVKSVLPLTFITQLLNYLIGSLVMRFYYKKSYYKNILYLSYPFGLMILFFFSLEQYSFSDSIANYIILLFILFTFICIFTINNIAGEIKVIETKNELEELKLKKNLLEEKYKFLQLNYEKNFAFFHELLHFFAKISELVNSKKYDMIMKDIEYMSNKTYQLFSEIYSNSPVLSTLIIENEKIIKENKISILPTIREEKITSLNLVDETNFISLLFKFALAACVATENENKVIIIKSHTIGKHKILTMSFSSKKDLLKDSKNKSKIEEFKEFYTKDIDISYNPNSSVTEITFIF